MIHDGRGGFEWGLASTAIGGVLVTAGIGALEIGTALADVVSLSDSWISSTLRTSIDALPAVAGAAAFMGVAFGLRSIMLARHSGRPLALGIGGIMLGIVALAIWAAVALAWHVATPIPLGFGGSNVW